MDHSITNKNTIMIVSYMPGNEPKIELETKDPTEADRFAETKAKEIMEHGGVLKSFRQMTEYKAEIVVNKMHEHQ